MDFLNEIWATINKNRSRSLLTAFGIFWGMMMLLCMIGLGNALKHGILTETSGVATNTGVVVAEATSKPYQGLQKGRTWRMRTNDTEAIQSQAAGVEYVSPMLFDNPNSNAHSSKTVGRGEHSLTGYIFGTTETFNKIVDCPLLYGRFLNRKDVQDKRKVCIIGEHVYKVCFPEGGDPCGQYLRVGGYSLQVIGVRAKTNSRVQLGGPAEEQVMLPISTLQQLMNSGTEIDGVMITALPTYSVKQVLDGSAEVLKHRHQIAPDDEDAVALWSMAEMFESLGMLLTGISVLIWVIGLGTLFAGAVGVSNIMLVTVRERTKEIGIRRALGASPWWIIRQILSESCLLTLLAGTLGIMVSVGVMEGVSKVLEMSPDVFIQEPQIDFSVAIVVMLILALIGLLAGLMPALRALSIKPIEALSEE